MYHKINIR
uniref:Uncharacterized protein n=1 Tax=Anguilla anguilla TaxID=7936 RepID=A0A0E9V0I0_ANGAN